MVPNIANSNELNYKNLPINVKERFESNFDSADYFNEEIRKYLYNKYGKEKLYSDGLIIKTTINTNLQSIADKVLVDGLLHQPALIMFYFNEGILKNPKTLKISTISKIFTVVNHYIIINPTENSSFFQ